MMRRAVALLALSTASAHFMWMQQNDDDKVSVTFSETPGKPGPAVA
jgi:hypothetical protein